jgi:hypothetical protein
MLEVKIPAEIRDYKGKLVLGLTVRQVVSVIGSLAVGVPLGVFGGEIIPADILLWVVIVAVAPIIAWGFATYKGMRFEEFVVVLSKFNFFPQKRVYEDTDENYFSFIRTVLSARDIRQQRIDSGEIDDEDLELEEQSYVF